MLVNTFVNTTQENNGVLCLLVFLLSCDKPQPARSCGLCMCCLLAACFPLTPPPRAASERSLSGAGAVSRSTERSNYWAESRHPACKQGQSILQLTFLPNLHHSDSFGSVCSIPSHAQLLVWKSKIWKGSLAGALQNFPKGLI